jgi:hypothetical protein
VDIPDPGQQTEVSFSVPADTGYRAGVLAVESNGTLKDVLAHGSSGQFQVQVDDTSQVPLDVRLADLTVELPSELTPGVTDTLHTTFEINTPGIDYTFFAKQSAVSEFEFFDGASLDRLGSKTETDTTISQNFSINGPDVDSQDTTYVKVELSWGSGESWVTPRRQLNPDFFPSQRGSSFEIPVVPGQDENGTIIITFSSDGTMKRRVVN